MQVDKGLDRNALDKKLAYLKEVNEFIKSHSFSDNVFVLKEKQKYTHLALIIDRISNYYLDHRAINEKPISKGVIG